MIHPRLYWFLCISAFIFYGCHSPAPQSKAPVVLVVAPTKDTTSTDPITIADTILKDKHIAIKFRPVSDTPGLCNFMLTITCNGHSDSARLAYTGDWEHNDQFITVLSNAGDTLCNTTIWVSDNRIYFTLPANVAGALLLIAELNDKSIKLKAPDIYTDDGFALWPNGHIGVHIVRGERYGQIAVYRYNGRSVQFLHYIGHAGG